MKPYLSKGWWSAQAVVLMGVTLVATVALTGCNLSLKREEAAFQTGTVLRAFQVGDYYEYTIRGSALKPGMKPEEALPVSGTMRVSVSESSLQVPGARVLRFFYTTSVNFNNQVFESRYALHYLQPEERNPRDLVLVAVEDANGAISTVDTEIIAVPGGWSVGYTRSYNTTIGTEPFLYDFAVVGRGAVKVPRGRFDCWRCVQTASFRPDNDPSESSTQTLWYAPNLGMPVLIELQTTFSSGTGGGCGGGSGGGGDSGAEPWSISVQKQLTYTTVPLPDINL